MAGDACPGQGYRKEYDRRPCHPRRFPVEVLDQRLPSLLVLTQPSPRRGPDALGDQDFLKDDRLRLVLDKIQRTTKATTPKSGKSNRRISRRANLRSNTVCPSK